MSLLDTTDARHPTPYARELAEQHRARRERFWNRPLRLSLPTKPLPAPVFYAEAHKIIDECDALNAQLVKEAAKLKELDRLKKFIRHKTVLNIVADFYNIPVHHIIGDSRSREVVRPRQVCMYLSVELTHRSKSEIGRQMGDRDHATVLWGWKKIGERILADPCLADEVSRLRLLVEAEMA